MKRQPPRAELEEEKWQEAIVCRWEDLEVIETQPPVEFEVRWEKLLEVMFS